MKKYICIIAPALDYSQPMPKADQDQVTAFCEFTGFNGYKANVPRSLQVQMNEISPVIDPDQVNDLVSHRIDFTLYPNPTNRDIVTMQLLRGYDSDSPIEITMHDLAGRLVTVKSESTGAGLYTIDVSNIAPGAYFVTGSTYGNKVTKRLIVQ